MTNCTGNFLSGTACGTCDECKSNIERTASLLAPYGFELTKRINRTALSEQDYLDLKENVRLINAGRSDVTMEVIQETVGDLLGALAGARDLAEIALSRMSEHESDCTRQQQASTH